MGCAAVNVRAPTPMREVVGPNAYDLIELDEKKNLELYYLFWVDRTVKSPEFIEIHDEMRSIINYLKVFETNIECEQNFRKIQNGKIFLIINYVQSISILPSIHDHIQLQSIYIYQNDENNDSNELKSKYKKIKGIYNSFYTAKRYLEDDIAIQTILDDPIIFNLSNEIDNDKYQEQFTLFLKTIYINGNNICDNQTRENLIQMCMVYYDDNEKEISFLKNFSQSYQSNDALRWYTNNFCLHRLLSRAFIDNDMSILAEMYPLIFDINQNIQQQNTNDQSSIHLFRCQLISNEKFNFFNNHINQLITMQCFFLAYLSRDKTFQMIENIQLNDINTRRIIFEIDAYENYTFVNDNESTTDKTEVLFTLGTIFKIIDVTETTIILSQQTSKCNENYDLANESPAIIQGILLYLKSGTTEAIQYFENLLKNEPQHVHNLSTSIYAQLGYLKQKNGNTNSANSMYEQAMNRGTMEINLYLYYLDQIARHYAFVLKDWQKAEMIWLRKVNIENACSLKQETIKTYENLIRIAQETKQYSKIIEYSSATLNNLSIDHSQSLFFQEQLENARKNLNK